MVVMSSELFAQETLPDGRQGSQGKGQDAVLDSLKTELEKAADDSLRIEILIDIGIHLKRNKPDAGFEYARRSVELSKKSGMKELECRSFLLTGAIHKTKGDYDSAMHYYSIAGTIAEAANYLNGKAKYHHDVGNVKRLLGRYEEAITDHEKAREFYLQSKDSSGLAGAYLNLGQDHGRLSNYEEALKNYNKALEISERHKNPAHSANALVAIANMHSRMGEFEKAHKGYEAAANLYSITNDARNMCGLRISIGLMYARQKRYKEGLIEYKKALIMAQTAGFKRSEALATGSLVWMYTELGEADSAFYYFNLYDNRKDSLFTVEMSGQIAEMEAKYEHEKAKKENELLAQEKKTAEAVAEKRKLWLLVIGCLLLGVIVGVFLYIRQRKAREKQARAELEQKALRSQMNPHFIFNSLSAIQNMYASGETDLANDYMGDFGELLRKILDNSGKERITVKEEVDILRLYLELEKLRSGGMVEYTIEVDEAVDPLNRYMPPMVIQPFVENAVWHGILPKEEKGMVNVELRIKNEELVCTVEDDGVGMNIPPSGKAGGPPSKGDLPTHEPKGMKLTEQRLGTPVKIEDLEPGTRVTITIPT